MKEIFYGDARDLVKWGGALRLAELYGLRTIFQVPYLPASDDRPSIAIEGHGSSRLTDPLWQHFRDVTSAESLDQGKIHVFRENLHPRQRTAYIDQAMNAMTNLPRPLLLLLDPDIGMAQKSDPEHTGEDEVGRFWKVLKKGDLLAIYQHAPHRKDWREDKRERLKRILSCEVQIIRGEDFAPDVILLFAKREE